jgi:transposase
MNDMDVVHARVCGLDVHKKTVVACRRRIDENGKVVKEVRSFWTMTRDLLELVDWMREWGVTHVAMESTGVYWKPIWNILEGKFEVILVNAQHLKKVPGRKTDVKDCEWIAQLLQYGLLSKSFVPTRQVRELRDLTRHRSKLVDQRSAVTNRIHKTLEDANIKLGAVATDILGVSGRKMLHAMAEGEQDPEKLADMAVRQLRKKKTELKESLTGNLTDHHRYMLKILLEQLKFLEGQIEALDKHIQEKMRPFEQELQLLDTIDGVDLRTAENLLAETGADMNQYPTAGHLASWAGMCPGNNESAGKRKTGKTAQGSKWLRRTLTQAAWAATRTKGTYLAAQYRRLASRRGKKRAVVAMGHTILVAAYQMLKQGVEWRDLGGDYFERRNPEKTTRSLVKRLQALGYEVELRALNKAA